MSKGDGPPLPSGVWSSYVWNGNKRSFPVVRFLILWWDKTSTIRIISQNKMTILFRNDWMFNNLSLSQVLGFFFHGSWTVNSQIDCFMCFLFGVPTTRHHPHRLRPWATVRVVSGRFWSLIDKKVIWTEWTLKEVWLGQTWTEDLRDESLPLDLGLQSVQVCGVIGNDPCEPLTLS